MKICQSQDEDLTRRHKDLKRRFVCLWLPTREVFTHMETSPLPLKGCQFWPMLGTHGHSAWGFFNLACHTYCDTQPFICSFQRTLDTHTFCRPFDSGAVPTCFYDLGLSRLGFENPTFRMRDKRSNLLHHGREDKTTYRSDKSTWLSNKWW